MFVGVDGCKKQWFAIILMPNGDYKVRLFPDISSLWDECSDADLILVDVPIGLIERGTRGRLCDIEARRLLVPKRGRSVFPAPCRGAIYADTHEKASNINRLRTEKGLSCQTWGIVPYIQQVDALLLRDEIARSRIREVHPEICFWALAGGHGHAMKHRKRTKEGHSERIEALKSVYSNTMDVVNRALGDYLRKDVGRDDILDALAAAVTATVGEERLKSIPEIPELDSQGLRMEMVYRPF